MRQSKEWAKRRQKDRDQYEKGSRQNEKCEGRRQARDKGSFSREGTVGKDVGKMIGLHETSMQWLGPTHPKKGVRVG
jgi:hypothetical protein